MDTHEDVLKEALMNECKSQFGLDEEWKIMPYFLFRYYLTHMPSKMRKVPDLTYNELASFLLDELGVNRSKNQLCVQHLTFSDRAYYGNTLRLIMENWWFQSEREKGWNRTKWVEAYGSLIEKARAKTRVKPSHPIFTEQLKSHGYDLLQMTFNAQPSGNVGHYLELHPEALYKPTQEEKTERLLLHYHHLMTIDRGVDEKHLEAYLIQNLSLLNEELKVVDTQVSIPNGRIDILARTADKQDVIIEVKTEKDTDILWQRMYYESEWMKRHQQPQMVIVSTLPLDNSIKDMLDMLGETTVYEVIPYIKNGNVVKVEVETCYTLGKPVLEAV